MALQKKPIYVFENENETEIFEVPEKRLVLVESLKSLFFLKDKTGLYPDSTIQQAIDNKNLIKFWNSENDGPYSGLEAERFAYWNSKYRLVSISEEDPDFEGSDEGDIWFKIGDI